MCKHFLVAADFVPLDYKGKPAPSMKREWPPYTGFGSEEDSLCSCMGLLPKPPRRDFIKFMEKDRYVQAAPSLPKLIVSIQHHIDIDY